MNILECLPEREQKIIILRYGLFGERVHTLIEIGVIFDISRERIRQIEAKAIRRLRHPKFSKILKNFLPSSV